LIKKSDNFALAVPVVSGFVAHLMFCPQNVLPLTWTFCALKIAEDEVMAKMTLSSMSSSLSVCFCYYQQLLTSHLQFTEQNNENIQITFVILAYPVVVYFLITCTRDLFPLKMRRYFTS